MQSVRLTAANHYVDLRYRVTDPERAQQLLGPGVKPRLIDERTGIAMAVPSTAKLGSLRQTQAEQKLDHTYFVLFINGAALQPASQGDCGTRVDDFPPPDSPVTAPIQAAGQGQQPI